MTEESIEKELLKDNFADMCKNLLYKMQIRNIYTEEEISNFAKMTAEIIEKGETDLPYEFAWLNYCLKEYCKFGSQRETNENRAGSYFRMYQNCSTLQDFVDKMQKTKQK